MKKLKRMLLFLFIICLEFLLLPLLIRDTGSGMLVLLFLMPAFCFAVSFFYGFKAPFSYFYPLFVSILFLPAIPIYFNASALIYSLCFGVIALIASYLAHFLDKKLHRGKN